MSIRAIGFDYSGVVARIPGPPWKVVVAAIFGVPVDTLQTTYFKFNHLLNEKIMEPADFWKKFSLELGKPEKYDEFMAYQNNQPAHEIDQQMIKLVDELRSSGYKVGLLSNNTIEGAAEIRQSELTKHFDQIVVSAEVGCSKPDPEAFKILAQRLGVSLEELIYIDDTEKSLVNASEIGFYPILFTDCQILRASLITAGVNIKES